MDVQIEKRHGYVDEVFSGDVGYLCETGILSEWEDCQREIASPAAEKGGELGRGGGWSGEW